MHSSLCQELKQKKNNNNAGLKGGIYWRALWGRCLGRTHGWGLMGDEAGKVGGMMVLGYEHHFSDRQRVSPAPCAGQNMICSLLALGMWLCSVVYKQFACE